MQNIFSRSAIISSIVIFLLSLSHNSNASVLLVHRYYFGAWEVQYHSNTRDKTGSCSIGQVVSGILFSILSYSKENIIISLSSDEWNVPRDTIGPVNFLIDSKFITMFYFEQRNKNVMTAFLSGMMDYYDEFIEKFSTGKEMIVSFPNGRNIKLSLSGSMRAYKEFSDCLEKWSGQKYYDRKNPFSR